MTQLFAEWDAAAVEGLASRLGNWTGLLVLATVVIVVTVYVMKPNKEDKEIAGGK